MKQLEVSNDKFKNLVSKICRDIIISDWRPDYVVGIGPSGLLAAVMISNYLNVPMQSVDINLVEGGSTSNLGMAEDAFGYVDAPKNILIVDDFNSTGCVFNWIIEDWPSGCVPSSAWWNEVWNKNVRFAALVNNLTNTCNTEIAYTGMEIDMTEDPVAVYFPYSQWWSK